MLPKCWAGVRYGCCFRVRVQRLRLCRPFRRFGATRRPNAQCPSWGSLERSQFICLVVSRLIPEASGKRLLELAPIRSHYTYFQEYGFEYAAIDLNPDRKHMKGINVLRADLCVSDLSDAGFMTPFSLALQKGCGLVVLKVCKVPDGYSKRN